jgi:hypothetical protein
MSDTTVPLRIVTQTAIRPPLNWNPRCMTIDEYRGWREAARGARPLEMLPCVDCTPAFAAAADAVGLCNGWPEAMNYDPRANVASRGHGHTELGTHTQADTGA